MLTKKKVKAMRKARAQVAARDMVERTVATVMKSLTEAQAGKDETVESKWTVEEWLDSLQLTTIISNSLCEELRKKSNDPRFERGIISHLGQISSEDGHTIVAELLESCLPRIAGKVVEESKVIYQELLEEQRGDKEGKVGGKFFDDAGAGQGRTFVLNFGDRNDFFGGLEKLVGPMDPISVRARMTKEHTKGPDAKASFEVGNYGTVTTSTYEWWFVVEPTPQKMAHLGLKTWPQESKLLKDKKSRSQMRQPLHPDTFREKIEEINERLKPMNQYLTSDLFIAARLYTGPLFVKYNGVLRAATGQPFFISCRDKLCLGNMYSTTLHTINNAITTLSGLSPSCNVYRGVSGGMLPEKFLAPDAQDNFRGGVELGFMSTTTNREVAYFYARGSNGLVFEMFMGLVDKGADLSVFSQYPYEAEICFPPLTALEVRGIKVEGSTTVVEVDARVCMTQAKASEDDLEKIKMFREIDADDSGELSLKEFKRLARQLIPDAADKTLEQIFRESDRDKTDSIDFEEYKQICVSKIMEEEEKMKVRQEKSANKRLEEALAQEREREKERVEKVLKRQEKSRREALLKEQLAAFDEEVDSRVSARIGPMRKSMAELAAEMLMGNLSDRLMLPSSRERRLMKLTKAIEGAALSEADVCQRVAETKTKQPRAPRSQSPKHPPRPGTSIGPIAAGHKFGWEPGSQSQPYTPRAVDAPRPPTPRTFEPLTPRMDLAEFMPELMTRRHSPRRDVTQDI